MPRRKLNRDAPPRMTTARPACTPRTPRDVGQAGVQSGPPSAPDPQLPPLRETPQGHETEGGIREPEVREPLQPLAVRIAYQMVRHALGKWGASKVTALDIRREGDTVVLTPVSSRHRPLQHYIEVPFTAEVLGQIACVLQELAAQAKIEEEAFGHRLLSVQRGSEG
jgi:hypothetical protein